MNGEQGRKVEVELTSRGWWLWDGYSSSTVAKDQFYVAAEDFSLRSHQSTHLTRERILVFIYVVLVTDEVCVMRETLPTQRTYNAFRMHLEQ